MTDAHISTPGNAAKFDGIMPVAHPCKTTVHIPKGIPIYFDTDAEETIQIFLQTTQNNTLNLCLCTVEESTSFQAAVLSFRRDTVYLNIGMQNGTRWKVSHCFST